MRFASLAVAVLAAASWSCNKSSGSSGPSLPAEDYSANFTGGWIGTQTGTSNGNPELPTMAAMQVTRTAANQLLLGGVCPDGSAVPGLVLGPATLAVPRFVCPAAAFPSCPSVTMTWKDGSGTLDNGELSLRMSGTLEGCGQNYAIVIQYDALRDAPPPEIATLSPAWANVGDPGLTLVVAGTGFAPKAIVTFGYTSFPTSFVSATELHTSVPTSALAMAGQVSVSVKNVDAQVSVPATFEVRNPLPVIASVAPASITAGTPSATITVNGSGFVASSQASCDGSPRATSYVVPTRVMVSLTADDLSVGLDRAITVTNPAPGGGTSNGGTLHVVNPVPVATGVFPASLAAGNQRAFVTVTGSLFSPTATVLWNGAARRTLFMSPSAVSAEILASDLASPSSATLSIVNPPPGGGTSPVGTVNIVAPSATPPRSVAYQVDAAHSGRSSSGGTLAFPQGSTWSVTLPDLISYPLVVGGKVFVLVRGSATGGYGTRLYALDLATGNTVWGPVAVSGTYFWAGHAYDGGNIFVINFDGRLRAFDAATGTAGWSVSLPGYWYDATPTAADGAVYVGGSSAVHAVNQSNGSVLWSQGVAGGDQSSPAVAPDAVYVSYPCQVYKLDRTAGAVIWHYSGGCSGGGGKTAAYSDAAVYVRDYGFGGSYGTIYDAFDGSASGEFGNGSYFPIPALDGDTRYVLSGGALERWERKATQATWSFAGDGQLTSAPLVIDDAVVVGSGSGTVFGVDAATGLSRWSGAAGAPIPGPDEQNLSQPLTGLGSGEGYLVVPAGTRLTAWKIVAP
jgi:outer membrane protein assembly factor BamB